MNTAPITWLDFLRESCTKFEAAGVEHPGKDIHAIVMRALDILEKDIPKLHHQPIPPEQFAVVQEMVLRRCKREPLDRIFGTTFFHELPIILDKDVFRPGHETQTTVDHALIALEKRQGPLRILDLGTGTGCVLLALLKHLPNATGLGVDRNEETLALARKNAEITGYADRVEFRVSDWTKDIDGKFDLVISNPPRIPSDAVPKLMSEVSLYDPREALDGGKKGTEYYQRTADDFRRIANDDAVCALQVGPIIADAALRVFHKAGFTNATIKRDYKMMVNCVFFENEKEKPTRWWARLLGV